MQATGCNSTIRLPATDFLFLAVLGDLPWFDVTHGKSPTPVSQSRVSAWARRICIREESMLVESPSHGIIRRAKVGQDGEQQPTRLCYGRKSEEHTALEAQQQPPMILKVEEPIVVVAFQAVWGSDFANVKAALEPLREFLWPQLQL